MATSKKGSKKSASVEPVPTDDPAVLAVIERAAVLEQSWATSLRGWLSSTGRYRENAFRAVSYWLTQSLSTPRVIPTLIELLPLVDEPRVVEVFNVLPWTMAGDPQRWLGALSMADEPWAQDPVRMDSRAAVVASLDVLLEYVKDRSPDVRARLAYVLAWLGGGVRERVVPALLALSEDASASVRASAAVALAWHGDASRIGALYADPDERVRCCAAIAASWAAPDERALAILEAAIEQRSVPWTELAFNNGELAQWATQRYGSLSTRFQERVTRKLLDALSTTSANDRVAAVIRAAFAGYAQGAEYSAVQRAVVAKVIATPTLQTNQSVQEFRLLGLVSAMNGITTQDLFDELRERFGLPRPPPTVGPMTMVTVGDRTKYAQHWIADFALEPNPESAQEIARAIAEAIDVGELVDVLVTRAQDLDGTQLAFERSAGVAYEVALPEGLALRDGRWVGAASQWPERARAWLAARQREGWMCSTLWWYGDEVTIGLFDLSGRHFELPFGHDWNRGSPNLDEVRAIPRPRWRLTALVARAARERDPAAFDEAVQSRLDAIVRDRPFDRWLGNRVTLLALGIFAGTSVEPPPMYDQAALWGQGDWTYMIATLLPYAMLLSPARREALALAGIAQAPYSIPLYYEVSRTPAVFDLVVQRAQERARTWGQYAQSERRRWAMVWGDAIADELVRRVDEAVTPPAPAAEKRRRRPR